MRLTPIILSLLVGSAVSVTAQVTPPDSATGQIGGEVAVMLWPRVDEKGHLRPDGKGSRFLSPEGCQAHLIPASSRNGELLYPCGVWFKPPLDGYRVWMEKGDLISPTHVVMQYSGGAFRGHGMLGVGPLGPAVRVAIPSGKQLATGETLRLLATESYRAGGAIGRVFTRSVTSPTVSKPMAMPEGPVIAGRFDANNNLIALSRPVIAHFTPPAIVWPEPPKLGTDVLVVLDRPGPKLPPDVDEARLTLSAGNGERTPDVFVGGADQLFAIWYGVTGKQAQLHVSSKTYFLPEQEIALHNQGAASLRSALKLRPNLHVSITAPPEAFPDGVVVSIIGTPSPIVPVHSHVNETVTLSNVPAEEFRVVVDAAPWKFSKRVDLRSGEDADVEFSLQPILVHGTVYLGSKPAEADVRFSIGGTKDWVAAHADNGHYVATFWRAGLYGAEARLSGSPTSAWFYEPFTEIDGEHDVDFHLPSRSFHVHVTSIDGNPVPKARLNATNIWLDEQGMEKTVSQLVESEDSSDITLPPPRAGTLRISAQAEGYLDSDPVTIAIDEGLTDGSATITLKPAGDETTIHVVRADDSAAGGAEVWTLRSNTDLVPIWEGRCDDNGEIRIPRRLGTQIWILVRDEHGASAVRGWNLSSDSIPFLKLATPAPPMSITVLDRAGRPSGTTPVAAWIDGIRLFGPPLSFLTWSRPFSNADGAWEARNLPAQPLRVLAFSRTVSQAAVAAGAFDGVATVVGYPFPARASVKIAE